MMNIGDRIRLCREKLDISRTELARLINTTKQTIYKYETGIVTNIPTDRIEQLSLIFNVTPSYLMGWEDRCENAASEDDSASLSAAEAELVDYYRELNPDGQEKLLDYAEDLTEMPKYKKGHQHEAVEKEA